MLEWNVFIYNYNSKKIEIHNVFDHNSFFEDCKKNAKKNIHDYNAFYEQLKRDTMYYYWSKCEWEIVVMPWVGKEVKPLKIDVFDQLKLNWETFCKYTWEHGAELRRKNEKTIDYINREDTIEAIKKQIENHPISYMDKMWNAALSCAIGQVKAIPSSDVIKLDEGIKIGAELAAMHGSDATSEELANAFFEGMEEGYKKGLSERKHGKWILKQEYDIDEEDGEKYWECSLCGCGSDSYDTTYHTNYCPNCGADMRKLPKESE